MTDTIDHLSLEQQIRQSRELMPAMGVRGDLPGYAAWGERTPEQKAEHDAQMLISNRQQAVSMASTVLIHSGCTPKQLIEMSEAIRIYCETGAVPGQTPSLHLIAEQKP